MTTTRRRVLAGGLAFAAAPAIIEAQAQPSAARTVKAVMHADLRVLDPIWTTANISAYHGGMIYDTLFGLDANFAPQPQMVSRWGVSDDKLTYTFELRDGLKFSDGAAVSAADCVASVRRWAARAAAGQTMMQRVKDTPVVDDKTFRIVLSEPYGLVIDSLSTISTSLCYMMRKKDAETDPNQQVRDTIGSGPFLYNRDETRPGNRHVYDRNPNYHPRSEAASGKSMVPSLRNRLSERINSLSANEDGNGSCAAWTTIAPKSPLPIAKPVRRSGCGWYQYVPAVPGWTVNSYVCDSPGLIG